MTIATRPTATQIAIVMNMAKPSKARASPTSVRGPPSVMSSQPNIASPAAAPAASTVTTA